jgi:hypothetical protein
VYCAYCQEEFGWRDEAVQARQGIIEVGSRSLDPTFVADEPDPELFHPRCLSSHFFPQEEAQMREEARSEEVLNTGAVFLESFEREEEIELRKELSEEEPEIRRPKRTRDRFRRTRR